jgi:hypothetical protein
MEKMTFEESIKDLITNFDGFEGLRSSIAEWYAGYSSCTLFKYITEADQIDQTYCFSKVIEFFTRIEKDFEALKKPE